MGLDNGPLDGEDTPPLNPGLEGGAALGSRVCVYMCMCEKENYVHVSLVGA